ncbi:MAG: ferrous iron transport protein B [Elusimicrobia bacterium]|nr:ferrous iron transport protein B [Elusimicrobiota bacterium]
MNKESVATQSIALVGNPNVGKSVLFGKLTGRYVTVSNYPGTTVDVARGSGWFAGKQMEVVDTPGILSLFPKSEDERVTRDLLLRERPDVVVQVADAKNLRRSLLITLELAELKIPMILALNMSDESNERGIEIAVGRLSQILGIPVVETVGITGEGMIDLRRAIPKAKVPSIQTKYLAEIESALEHLSLLLPEDIGLGAHRTPFHQKRFVAETFLFSDFSIWITLQPLFSQTTNSDQSNRLKSQCMEETTQITKKFVRSIPLLTLDSRQQKAGEIVAEVVQVTGTIQSSWAQTFGRLATRPWPGYGIALLALFLMYEFVGVFGAQFLVNIIEGGLFNKILNPAVTKIVELVIPFQILQEMIVGPYGLFTMAVTYALALIFPIVTCFFLFFGILEDSGYLPRLAIMLDRVFRVMGLNGKAVLPMILGLGCDTMATLTTRVLDTKKEKIIVSILLTLSIPCSAQLGAMLGMVAGLSWKVFALWLGVVLGTMVGVGWAAAKILPGIRSPFLMEIPPIRKPQIKNLFKKIRARLAWYLREAVPMFLLGTFLLFVSDKIGLLEIIKKVGNPMVVQFLGLPEKATESFIIGFLRRDYGAAGFFMLAQNNLINPVQITVALIVITLFMPCIAQFFVTIKERGIKTSMAIFGFVLTFSILVGGLVNWIFKLGWIRL